MMSEVDDIFHSPQGHALIPPYPLVSYFLESASACIAKLSLQVREIFILPFSALLPCVSFAAMGMKPVEIKRRESDQS